MTLLLERRKPVGTPVALGLRVGPLAGPGSIDLAHLSTGL